ncbi:MAG: hypothetical protein VKO64_03780 [Candidatus Sericytochromatia bacterium]|nr:hypothetical protein [Candidatus Sericytochromatia bacterium]
MARFTLTLSRALPHLAVLLAGCSAATVQAGTASLAGAPGNPGVEGKRVAVVRDASGAAVVGARIRAFEATQVPAGLPANLVSNAAGGLVSNAAGAFRTLGLLVAGRLPRRIQAIAETTTDANGTYGLDLPAGTYNIEAAASDGRTKAWRGAVRIGVDGSFAGEPFVLQPVGRISGRVTVADATVTDLLRTQVFVPGSSYVANTTADGRFIISEVPAGTFPLFAWHPTLGEAMATGAAAVQVAPGSTAEAGPLRLGRERPRVDALLASGSDRTVVAAAPGASLALAGEHFGAAKGRAYKVEVQGVTALSATRDSDSRIRFDVPAGARNGNVTLEVDGVFAEPLPLRVLKSVQWKSASLMLASGATADLHVLLEVRDTDDIAVVPVREGGGWAVPPAELAFRTDVPRVHLGADGVLRALSEGEAAVTVTAGSLPPRTLVVQVLPEGQPVPTPTPAPTATPAPPPTPVPTPVPTPAPTPTPDVSTRYTVAGTFAVAARAPDGATVVSGTPQGQVVIADGADGGNVMLTGHPNRVPAPVVAVAVAPGGSYVAASWADGVLALFDRSGRVVAFTSLGAPARHLMFDPRANGQLVGGLLSGHVAVLNGGSVLRMVSLGSEVRFLDISGAASGGKAVVTAIGASGRLLAFDVDSSTVSLDTDISGGRGVFAAAAGPYASGKLAWVDGSGNLRLRTLLSAEQPGSVLVSPSGPEAIGQIGFEPDGQHLLIARGTSLRRHRLADGGEVRSWTLKAVPVGVLGAAGGMLDLMLANGSVIGVPAP